MSKRMSEWEVQQVANNLDRMNSYRFTKTTGQEYVDPSAFSGRISEWDAQQVANNLDRINSYRMESMSLDQTILVIKLCLIFFAILGIYLLYAVAGTAEVFAVLTIVFSIGIGLIFRKKRK